MHFFKVIFLSSAEMVGWYAGIDPLSPQGSTGAISTAQVDRDHEFGPGLPDGALGARFLATPQSSGNGGWECRFLRRQRRGAAFFSFSFQFVSAFLFNSVGGNIRNSDFLYKFREVGRESNSSFSTDRHEKCKFDDFHKKR